MCLHTAFHPQGHCALEMPSGTGKTVSLLSLIVAYQRVSYGFILVSTSTISIARVCPLHCEYWWAC